MKPKPKPKSNGHDPSASSKPRPMNGNGKVHGRPNGVKNKPQPQGLDGSPLWGGDRTMRRKGYHDGNKRITNHLLKFVVRKVEKGKQILPLEFMLATLNDGEMDWKCRAWAAKEAAPYLHRRMPIAIEGGAADKPLVFATAEQLQHLPTAQLEVLMQVMSKFSHEELAKATGLHLPATIDHTTGGVVE